MKLAESTRYVGLLRGINLGKANRIAMADLRAWVAELGLADVSTYIASGNVLFTTESADDATLAATIESRIATETGKAIGVVVRSHDELVTALDENPFPDVDDGTRLVIGFMNVAPPDEVRVGLDAIASGHDEVRIIGRTLYLSVPDGQARSKLAEAVGKGFKGVVVTTRNLNTMRKLAELTA